MKISKTVGYVSAPLTPFKEDGSVNYEMIPQVLDLALSQGCVGVFINGTTGEGLFLSIEERKKVAETYAAAMRGRAKLIVHVGANSVVECQELSKHASSIHADAVAAIPPFYQKPSNLDNLVSTMGQIAAAAPDLPFYYYHIPGLTNVNFQMYDFMSAALGKIPNLVGLKFSSYDLPDFSRVLRIAEGSLDCFYGSDQAMLSALAVGCTAFVGSSYGVWGKLFEPVISNFNSGNLVAARAAQGLCTDTIAIMENNGGLTTHKALVRNIHGVDFGGYRLPLVAASDATIAKMMQQLQDCGFRAAVACD